MTRNKKKPKKTQAPAPTSTPPASSKKKAKDQRSLVAKWDNYMGKGELEDWQRLMSDLGFTDDYPSKTKCRKALRSVWVNIPDFLYAVEHGEPVRHFRNQSELANYTTRERKFFPKKQIEKGSPLRGLLASILPNSRGKAKGEDDLLVQMRKLMIAETEALMSP